MSLNVGNAIVIVGCLTIHLLSLIYSIPFPSWILWIVGLLAAFTWAYHAFGKERAQLFKLRVIELELKIELLRQKLLRGKGQR